MFFFSRIWFWFRIIRIWIIWIWILRFCFKSWFLNWYRFSYRFCLFCIFCIFTIFIWNIYSNWICKWKAKQIFFLIYFPNQLLEYLGWISKAYFNIQWKTILDNHRGHYININNMLSKSCSNHIMKQLMRPQVLRVS